MENKQKEKPFEWLQKTIKRDKQMVREFWPAHSFYGSEKNLQIFLARLFSKVEIFKLQDIFF